MGSAYTIMGRSVPSHQLALATLGCVVLLVLPKPWGAPAPKHPAINAGSKEEEKFVKEYLSKKGASEGH